MTKKSEKKAERAVLTSGQSAILALMGDMVTQAVEPHRKEHPKRQ